MSKDEKTLSIFADESGRFQYPDPTSRFYIVSIVLHDQAIDITPAIVALNQRFRNLHLEKLCFHAGPLIRQEKAFAIMDRSFRYRIFAAMMAFARQIDFHYHCLVVDKKDVTSSEHILKRLSQNLTTFLTTIPTKVGPFNRLKLYYDCGQSPVTNLLHNNLRHLPGINIEFAQGVKPENYRLFQLADLICTTRFIAEKIRSGEGMTQSEFKFFGGPKSFHHNVLRYLTSKEWR